VSVVYRVRVRVRWLMDAGVDAEGAVFALRIVAGVAQRGGQGSGEGRLRDAGSWHQHDMASSDLLPVEREMRFGRAWPC
jgi:hypothetical protein